MITKKKYLERNKKKPVCVLPRKMKKIRRKKKYIRVHGQNQKNDKFSLSLFVDRLEIRIMK